MNIYSLITVIEVLCVNTYTTYKCSKNRKSKLVTLILMCIVTLAISVLLLPVVTHMPTYGNGKGNGLFMLFGFFYVIPLKFLFDQPIKHLIIIMSSSWIYTMFAFSFSFRIGLLLQTGFLGLSVVIVQTLFFMLTFPYYKRFVDNTFIYILKSIENKMINSLLAISLLWFFSVFLLNYTFVEGSSFVVEFMILFIVICNAVLSYKLAYNLVSVNNKAKELSQITQIDNLTQLRNREGLYEDAIKRIDNNKCFTIIYMDLDNFKSVNDSVGHAAGDKYLIEFVKTVKEKLKVNDGFYRLHGDEFVFLVDRLEVETLCREMEKLDFLNHPNGLAFKGISLGYSSYPADGNNLSELLYLADLRMYQIKKEKHKI